MSKPRILATRQLPEKILPVLINGPHAYASGHRGIYALKTDTWDVEWCSPIKGSPGELALDGDTIYHVSSNIFSDVGVAQAICARSGKSIWERRLKGFVTSSRAIVEGDIALFGGTVYALDKKTGKTRWRSNNGIGRGQNVLNSRNSMLLCYYQESLIALDVQTGKELWREGRMGANCYPASFDSDRLFVVIECACLDGTGRRELVQLDPKTGEAIWKSRFPAWGLGVFAGEITCFQLDDVEQDDEDYAAILAAVNMEQNRLLWRVRIEQRDENRGLQSVQPWRMHEQTLYITTSNEDLYAVNRETGAIRWKLENNEGSLSGYHPLTIHEGRLYARHKEELIIIQD